MGYELLRNLDSEIPNALLLSYKRCNYEKIEVRWQGEHSECALACITMLLNYYGNQSTLVELRENMGCPKED